MTKPISDVSFDDVQRNLRVDGDVAHVRKQQELSDAYWESLRQTKHVQDNAPIGDFHMVASIPCLKVEEWMRQGFDMFDPNVTIEDVLKRLRAEDSERLITTSRTNF
jgi:hypothetical protein